METVKIRKLSEKAVVPQYATQFSAGADLHALCDKDTVVNPGETVLFATGISLEISEGCVGLIFARSGLSTKKGLAPANKVGVIDSDYRGEIKVSLYNQSASPVVVADGERIAQLVIIPYIKACFEEAEYLGETVRGEGGFGSTGK